MKWLAIFDILPGWAYALIIAGLLALGVVQQGQLMSARLEVAQLTATAATEKAQREEVARVDAEQVARAQFRHAERQQEITDESAKREAARVATDNRLRADNQRLRDAILAAPGRGQEGGADAAASGSDGDLARQLSADLAEAVGLQGEAEEVIRRRDDEVRLLLQQLATDREAVQSK